MTDEKKLPPHPMQPLILDGDGRPRFRGNAIIMAICENAARFVCRSAYHKDRLDLSAIAALPNIPQEDREQFAQLIGYSLGGYHELSYVSDESADAASAAAVAAGLINNPRAGIDALIDARTSAARKDATTWGHDNPPPGFAPCTRPPHADGPCAHPPSTEWTGSISDDKIIEVACGRLPPNIAPEVLVDWARALDAPPPGLLAGGISRSESVPVPRGPGKCPGCDELEDGNTPTGHCMECVAKVDLPANHIAAAERMGVNTAIAQRHEDDCPDPYGPHATCNPNAAYLVVLEDRHTDDEISVHRTYDGAKARVAEHMADYPQYTWEEGNVEGWDLLMVTDSDDGPNVHIEELEVEE